MIIGKSRIGVLERENKDQAARIRELEAALAVMQDTSIAHAGRQNARIATLEALIDRLERLAVGNITGCGTCTTVVNEIVAFTTETVGEPTYFESADVGHICKHCGRHVHDHMKRSGICYASDRDCEHNRDQTA